MVALRTTAPPCSMASRPGAQGCPRPGHQKRRASRNGTAASPMGRHRKCQPWPAPGNEFLPSAAVMVWATWD